MRARMRQAASVKRDQARLTIALTLSLLVHALLLSLQFGIPGLGLPGLQMPWDERRARAPDLSVRIVNADKTAEPPAPPASPVSAGPAPSASEPATPAKTRTLQEPPLPAPSLAQAPPPFRA